MITKAFTVTDDHLKLARRMYVYFEAGIEWGAPAVDPKRPYGNSSLYDDMREILGAQHSDERLHALHVEMATVIQIALRTGSFAAGDYVARAYHQDWRPASPSVNADATDATTCRPSAAADTDEGRHG